jgi:DNA-binding NarL/FixJ family response regulator
MAALRILYLEDHAVFATQVCGAFLAAHNVTVVNTLVAARAAASNAAFDLLIADYDLEDGKGDCFVREFRRQHPKTAIIAASSHEDGNAALKRAGANAICGKLDFDKIGDVLRKLGLVGPST